MWGGLTGKVAPSPKLSLLRRVGDSERPGRRQLLRFWYPAVQPWASISAKCCELNLSAGALIRKKSIPHETSTGGHSAR